MTLTTLEDLNALGTDSVLLLAMDLIIPNTPTIRVVNNGENITFGGNEYVAFPFSIGEISAGKGETPSFQLVLDNTTRVIEKYIVDYDTYLKQNGIDGNGISAILHVVNTKDLSESVLTEYFELSDFSADSKSVTFNLGTSSLFNKTYPPRKMYGAFCSFKFKDTKCGYSGLLTTCNKTLSDCRERGNSVRYGGFVGLSSGVRV